MPLKLFKKTDFTHVNPSPIGRGTYGEVYKMKLKSTGEDVVVKTFKQSNGSGASIAENVGIYADLVIGLTVANKPGLNTAGPLGYTMDKNFGLVYKYLSRPLHGWRPKDRDDAKSMIRKILQQLALYHSMGFVHSDLKPDNIMLDANDNVYIIDYGLSRYLGIIPYESFVADRFLNTETYKAPDHSAQFGYLPRNMYNYNTDLYSVAQILGEFFDIFNPKAWEKFILVNDTVTIAEVDHSKSRSNGEYHYRLVNPNATPILNAKLGPHGDAFIKGLIGQTGVRLTAEEALKHPFLSSSQTGSGRNLLLNPHKVGFDRVTEGEVYSKRLWFSQMDNIINFYKDLTPMEVAYTDKARDAMYELMSDLVLSNMNLNPWVTDTVLNLCRIGLGSDLTQIQAWTIGEMLNSVLSNEDHSHNEDFTEVISLYFNSGKSILNTDNRQINREFIQLISQILPKFPFVPYTSFIDYVTVNTHIYGGDIDDDVKGFLILLYIAYMLIPTTVRDIATMFELTGWGYTRFRIAFNVNDDFGLEPISPNVMDNLEITIVDGLSDLVHTYRDAHQVFGSVIQILHISGLEFPQDVLDLAYTSPPENLSPGSSRAGSDATVYDELEPPGSLRMRSDPGPQRSRGKRRSPRSAPKF